MRLVQQPSKSANDHFRLRRNRTSLYIHPIALRVHCESAIENLVRTTVCMQQLGKHLSLRSPLFRISSPTFQAICARDREYRTHSTAGKLKPVACGGALDGHKLSDQGHYRANEPR